MASESSGVCQTEGKGMEMRWSTGTPAGARGDLVRSAAEPGPQGSPAPKRYSVLALKEPEQ